ncbi:protein DMP10-like [Diospyros lotus]|uniref:protein DMP10-like n=1 Tax=Diospyros lotus TaxID=55363 RepID=UPI00224D2F86|nr:protein DMP10-like [Diospyros lotus]
MEDQSMPRGSNHLLHKTLDSAASLANLLPTGTVLAFQALTPSFSNHGTCQMSNKYLTISLVGFCAALCFLSSFTDSFVDGDGKFYYGIATFKGLYIFNYDNRQGDQERKSKAELARFKIGFIDFVHAFVSLVVFSVLASSDPEVQSCLFPAAGANRNVLIINLPLGAGVLSSFLFILFPATRRGIGYAETAAPPGW